MSSLITGSLESSADPAHTVAGFEGNDRALLGIIMDALTGRPERSRQNCDDRLRAQHYWIVVDWLRARRCARRLFLTAGRAPQGL
jgi:hypothetical protein